MKPSRTRILCCLLLLSLLSLPSTALAQAQRTPSETVRQFYKLLREKKYREAFAISIYRHAAEPLSAAEFEDFRVDFDRIAFAITERIPANVDVTGEQISGDAATVFLKMLDADGKEKIEPTALIKVDNVWIVGDMENLELVKKQGKKFFYEARINAHHNDVQDMLTRISLMQVAYAQGHDNKFANMAELVAAGMIPKDIEGTETTGYRFQIVRSADGKSWYATAEPAQYGRTGRLSFYLDASGVRSADVAGKPLVVKN
ncbi:MAG TPA: hypothetical protein VFR78_12135 [Pyrinomonadaceae bacterium]|nr:hypothetical protein [Pyrinomonadaceae bacterium]